MQLRILICNVYKACLLYRLEATECNFMEKDYLVSSPDRQIVTARVSVCIINPTVGKSKVCPGGEIRLKIPQVIRNYLQWGCLY